MRFDEEQRKIFKDWFTPKATDKNVDYCIQYCEQQDLNPFRGEAAFMEFKGKYTPVATLQAVRKRADSTGELAGQDEPVYGKDDIGGEYCSVTVYRMKGKERCPTTHRIYRKEFDTKTQQWAKRPLHMMAIRAESHALKKGFYDKVGGLNIEGEVDDHIIEGEPSESTGDPAKEVRFSKVVAAFAPFGITKVDLLAEVKKETVDELDEKDFETFTAWHNQASEKN